MSDETPDTASAPATLPKPGWYEESGRVRWWDGAAWTNEYAGEPVKPGAAQPAQQASVAPGPVKPKRRVPAAALIWVSAGAFLIGIFSGASTSSGARSEVAGLQDDLTAAENRSEVLQAELDDLDDQQAALDAQALELAAREAAVTTTEQTIAANTIPGSGIYLVGADIQPGTYRSEGNTTCYWARLGGLTGTLDEIHANDNAEGQAVVSILPSDVAFETSRCTDWTKIG